MSLTVARLIVKSDNIERDGLGEIYSSDKAKKPPAMQAEHDRPPVFATLNERVFCFIVRSAEAELHTDEIVFVRPRCPRYFSAPQGNMLQHASILLQGAA